MSEIQLKPCPFCGARSVIGDGPRLTGFNSIHIRIYEVHCEQCNATINRWFDSEQEAAEVWNNRAYAQPEQLTDKEQRIFLAAMQREEKVCKQVDEECRDCREPYEDSLVSVCREIKRKVKGVLWT